MRSDRSPGLRPISALLILAVLGGCYHYQPVLSPDVPAPGDRIRITPAADRPEGQPLPSEETDPVEGLVIEWGATEVTLDVPPSDPHPLGGQGRAYVPSDTISFPIDRMGYVERRELDRWRTARWTIGGGTALGILAKLMIDWVRSAPDNTPPPPQM